MEPSSTKAPDAFRTISEVAEELDLPQHVLRFWETRFTQIKPMKRGGGRRYYRPEDVNLLRGVRHLLYSEGFTIRGVQRLLKEKGIPFVAAVGETGSVEGVSPVEEDGPPDSDVEQDIEAEAEKEAPQAAEAAKRGKSKKPVITPPKPAAESPAPSSATTGISKESRRKLESVLSELTEAKRLLDQVR